MIACQIELFNSTAERLNVSTHAGSHLGGEGMQREGYRHSQSRGYAWLSHPRSMTGFTYRPPLPEAP